MLRRALRGRAPKSDKAAYRHVSNSLVALYEPCSYASGRLNSSCSRTLSNSRSVRVERSSEGRKPARYDPRGLLRSIQCPALKWRSSGQGVDSLRPHLSCQERLPPVELPHHPGMLQISPHPPNEQKVSGTYRSLDDTVASTQLDRRSADSLVYLTAYHVACTSHCVSRRAWSVAGVDSYQNESSP